MSEADLSIRSQGKKKRSLVAEPKLSLHKLILFEEELGSQIHDKRVGQNVAAHILGKSIGYRAYSFSK